ncbi:MAG: hypothetical protein ACK4YP_09065 [Myxococcota bacterium]
MSIRLLPVLLVLAGCPDPTASPEGAGGSAGAPGAGAPPPGEAGPPGAQGGSRPTPQGFQVTAGEGVKLSGTVSYAGTKTGPVTVDFLRQAQGGTFPELVHSVTLPAPGPFEVEAPKDAGDIAIVAFIDSNGNGPDPGEPAGRVKDMVKVGAEPVTGLEIALSDAPDLGDLAPGGAGGATPPPGGAEGTPPVQGTPGEAPAGTPPAGTPPAAPPAGGEAPAAPPPAAK